MGASHGPALADGLHLSHRSPVHALPAHVKIVAATCFVFCVVATPRSSFWAFGAYAALLAVVAILAKVPPPWLARRALIEVPFVMLAVLLPFVSEPRDAEFLGVAISSSGTLAAWNLFAKGTLGVLTSLLLAATTPIRGLLVGLEQLKLPPVITQIATLMVRYLAVILDQARRMRTARLARGYDPRFIWQVGAFAASLGSLFLRSYERGERVYLAMVSRGYSGTMPDMGEPRARRKDWVAALLLPACGLVIVTAAWVS